MQRFSTGAPPSASWRPRLTGFEVLDQLSVHVIPSSAQLPFLTPCSQLFSAAPRAPGLQQGSFCRFWRWRAEKSSHNSLLPLVFWLSCETGQYREMFAPKHPSNSRNCDPAQESHLREPHPVAASVCWMGQSSWGSPERMAEWGWGGPRHPVLGKSRSESQVPGQPGLQSKFKATLG